MKLTALLRIAAGALLVLTLLSGNALADQKYKVKRGDTLASIAKKTGVSVAAIKKSNNLKSGNLKISQELTLPLDDKQTTQASPNIQKEFYSVKKGDTLSSIASKTGVSVDEIKKYNKIATTRLKVGQKLALKDRSEPLELLNAPSEQLSASLKNDQSRTSKTATNLSSLSSDAPEEAEKEVIVIDEAKRKLLGEWNTPEEPRMLVNVALAFLGAPYRLGGSSVRGIDCSGFVQKIYSLFGIDLPRTAAEQSHTGVEVARSSLAEGDLIFFKTKNTISHVGIYIGNNKFVHAASSNKGVRVDSLDSAYYKTHYTRAIRLKAKEKTAL